MRGHGKDGLRGHDRGRLIDDHELLYDLDGKTEGNIQIWASAFSVSDDLDVYGHKETKISYIERVLAENLGSYLNKVEIDPYPELDVFDYLKTIAANRISYIVCRYRYEKFDIFTKFANDPAFSLEFINDEVAVFMVKRTFN